MALAVAHEPGDLLLEEREAGLGELGALLVLGAVGEQAHAGALDAADDARVRGCHEGEVHHVAGVNVGVRAHVGKHRHAAGHVGQRAREAGAHRADLGTVAVLERLHEGSGGGGASTGRAGREEALGVALAHRTASNDDRRLALAHDRLDGIVLHGDDIGSVQRLGATGVLGAERVDDLGGSASKHREVGVCLERLGDAAENDLRLLVAAHDVYANGYLLHMKPSLREQRCSSLHPARYRKGRLKGSRPYIILCVATRGLLGDDDLAVLVEAAVGAHTVRKLHSAALRADGTRGSAHLHVRGTTVMGSGAAFFVLRYCHDDLP